MRSRAADDEKMAQIETDAESEQRKGREKDRSKEAALYERNHGEIIPFKSVPKKTRSERTRSEETQIRGESTWCNYAWGETT